MQVAWLPAAWSNVKGGVVDVCAPPSVVKQMGQAACMATPARHRRRGLLARPHASLHSRLMEASTDVCS